jgi:hypothetical protein
MKIRSYENGSRALSVCSWKLAPDCKDKKITNEKAQLVATIFGIQELTHDCCKECLRLVLPEED